MDGERLIERLPRPLRVAMRLAVATVRDAANDRISGLAAEVAFWTLLSFPPLLLVAASTAGFVGDAIGEDVRSGLIDRLGELAGQVFTAETVDSTVRPTLDALLTSGSTPVLSLSFLATVYSASRALRVIVIGLNLAYDLEEVRPTWVARALGLLLTIVALVVGLVLIPLMVAGPALGAIVERRLGMDLMLAEVYQFLYWPAALLVVTLVIAGLYHLATPFTTPFRRELPGAVLATILGLLANQGLRLYTTRAFGGDEIYAALAAPLALLVWTYLQGLSLLLGAELNGEIEKAFPSGRIARPAPELGELGRRAAQTIRQIPRPSRGDLKNAPEDADQVS